MESGRVDSGGLLVAGSDPSPLVTPVDASLGGVALLVCLAVEGGQPAAVAAPAGPATLLVGWDRDERPDPSSSQVFADGSGGVRLVGQNQSGRVRGRPTRWGMRGRVITSVKAGASPACPVVGAKAGDRQLPSGSGRSKHADVGTTWRPVERSPRGDQRDPVPRVGRHTVAGRSGAFWQVEDHL